MACLGLAVAAPAGANWLGDRDQLELAQMQEFYRNHAGLADRRRFEEAIRRLMAQDEPEGALGTLRRSAPSVRAEAPSVPAPAPIDPESRDEQSRSRDRALWERIQTIAREHAQDGLEDLLADYLWSVVKGGGGSDEDVKKQVAAIRGEVESGGSGLPLVREGPMPSVPNGMVLATYVAGANVITMRRGLRDKRVLSHEFFHWGDDMHADETPIGDNGERDRVLAAEGSAQELHDAVAACKKGGDKGGKKEGEKKGGDKDKKAAAPAAGGAHNFAEEHAYSHMGCDAGLGGDRC